MSIEELRADDWMVYWAGRWSLLSDSYAGQSYMRRPYAQMIERFVSRAVFLFRDGLTTTCIRETDRRKFANDVKEHIQSGDFSITEICSALKDETDAFLSLIDRDEGKDITVDQFQNFVDRFYSYYPMHVFVKNLPDVMTESELTKYMEPLEDARLYAEPVYRRYEDYLETLAKIVGEKEGYMPASILATISEEFVAYLKGGKLPDEEILQNRYGLSALVFDEKSTEVFLNEDAKNVEQIILGKDDPEQLKGQVAYKGVVRGKVRVVFDPTPDTAFGEGDILVSGMTRPEFLPLMKKASAFVTDGGGILCHAAIVAREMQKPCVIGTKIATRVFKDGDMVEVDADNGIVKKVK
ncbi:MAG: hypothetical protein COU35_02500 [Candidatus Magasanikbacteria bacterium CG10_big_fil_rev_8_21_14_0_10_47_10]|uniref:PEP-utilising enzyme mobile domain-containing protein n=1 Tax=Candidatus Magasanikbacteria bacterium CG10_big_fil_rev_8_21_14_0_10_47_10 TaxID=1974652 RepID=A0A2H0TQK9_9BACT|nr:MAG: hypothetical protein COU35_02500 [Candidatus Magasanikbacteria bacterium CG10_big_fil_rev_8_21_14_0_10_47_10]